MKAKIIKILEEFNADFENPIIATRYIEDIADLLNELLDIKPFEKLLHLHACEQEGIDSGQPTVQQWLEAVEDAKAAIKELKTTAMKKSGIEKQQGSMNLHTVGQLTELCQQVSRGSKPCAMMPILKRDQGSAKMHVTIEDCKFRFEELSDDHFTLWVYIEDELMQVIDCLPPVPETAADHYLLGALFGYSNQAICEYIKKHVK